MSTGEMLLSASMLLFFTWWLPLMSSCLFDAEWYITLTEMMMSFDITYQWHVGVRKRRSGLGAAGSGGNFKFHYSDVIMGGITSKITSLTIVYSTVYSGTDQRKYQNSASLAFVRGIHRGPVNSPHKWLVTRKMFPFDDVIMPLPLATLS